MNCQILKVIFLIIFMKGVTSTLFAQGVKTELTRSPDVIIKPVTGSADFGATLACGDINGDGTHGAVGRSSLDILNINGQSVRVWDLTGYGPGQYELKWDGRNDYNDPLPSGIYFCRLRYGNEVTIGKMVLIR